jgi:DNA-binding transcriptional regulator LsrR (DeoR family)
VSDDSARDATQRNSLDRPITLIERRLDLAARAAWLYHAKGQRQDEIAYTLNISRPIVQRLIALAAAENLIRFQLVHPLAECVSLADRIKDRFQLEYSEIVPSVAKKADNVLSVAAAAALYLECLFSQTEPVTVGIGGRRVISDAALRVSPMHRPMHRLFSLMGNMTREGRAGHYDVILGLAERIGAQCYPLPMPVVANSVEEKELLQAQVSFRGSLAFAEEASTLMMGICFMDKHAPLYADGFITKSEQEELIAAGAVGETLGYCFDANGDLLDVGFCKRVTSFRLKSPPARRTLLVQCGPERVAAIRAALVGRLANGLITDEETARGLLDVPPPSAPPRRSGRKTKAAGN